MITQQTNCETCGKEIEREKYERAVALGKTCRFCYNCLSHHVERRKRSMARRNRDQAMRDLGLVKVKGALGGTYWE
jgi:hypothetical protein